MGHSKLLVISDQNQITHSEFSRLEDFMESSDLLVVNRSATLPGSFLGQLKRTGEKLEIRLAAFQGPNPNDLQNWMAISFGAGNWRQSTESRGKAPAIEKGDKIVFSSDLSANIKTVRANRLLEVQFVSSDPSVPLVQNLYKNGRPIQYSYHKKQLEVWDQQSIFSGPPISVEPPSASLQFTWQQLFRLRAKGVAIASLLHSAGISSSGDENLDQLLPLQEWYQIPERTVQMINRAKNKGRKVVALGTTVLRALESATVNGRLRAGNGLASLKISPGHHFSQINALVTGMHDPESSHMKILDSLCPIATVQEAYRQATKEGYRGHEYGDLSFLKCRSG